MNRKRLVLSRAVMAARVAAGGPTNLAGHLGISSQAVSQWERIPAEHVPAVSKATGLPRHVLRPDLWEKGK